MACFCPEDRLFSKPVQDGLDKILALYPLLAKYNIPYK